MSWPLTITALLTALGLCAAVRGEGTAEGCDGGKPYKRDLPQDAVWICPGSSWLESAQSLHVIDTTYDPEPARQVCCDKTISYNLPIPNSGAFRPLRAQSGEYLYCPPQRWLNNLHHGAAVLLYHPCAPLHERLRLSLLARTCLSAYIVTPHPELSERTPVTLVSWGRTLELSTSATTDVCDWLEAVTMGRTSRDVVRSRTYSHLLTRPAKRYHHTAPETTQSVRSCCERILSLPPGEGAEAALGTRREISLRAVRRVRSRRSEGEDGKQRKDQTSRQPSAPNSQDGSESSVESAPGTGTPPQLRDGSPSPGSATSPGGNGAEETLSLEPSGSRTSALQPNPGLQQPSSERPDPGKEGLVSVPSGRNALTHRAESHRPDQGEVEAKPKKERTELLKKRDKVSGEKSKAEVVQESKKDSESHMKDGQLVDVKQRELEKKQQAYGGTGNEVKTTAPPVAARTRSRPQDDPKTHIPGCGGCGPEGRCYCSRASGPAGGAALAKVLPPTPRSDEAVWAAAALGFLLVLLALSVLHTRLYRHWRSAPSLYWHDPRQDYDSVADVIRRRLRIAERRRKRRSQSRRQECVLLPSSSSSEEDM